MTHRSLLLAALVVVLSYGMALACTKPPGADALGAQMIGWINQQRQAHGLGVLAPSAKLAAAAQGHACDMAKRGYFEHQRRGGPDLAARIKAQGYRFGTVAENLAKTGVADVPRTGNLWRGSPGHWANILKPEVSDIGMGLAIEQGQTLWVMNVGRSR